MRNRGFEDEAGSGFDGSRASHINGGAFREFDIDVAHIERAAIQRLRGRDISFSRSAVGLAVGDEVVIRQSVAGVVAARSVAADELRTGVLIAPVVRGDVHTWFDMRSAVAIGFGMGLAKIMGGGLRAVGRRLF